MNFIQLHTTRLLVFILMLLSCTLFSQTKDEREEKIKLEELPVPTQELVEILPEQCRQLKFYRETDGAKLSFEVKFKYQKNRFSLEFDPKGTIEDIEKTIDNKILKDPSKSTIKAFFTNAFKTHILIKIQKQYVYNAQLNPKIFIDQVLSDNFQGAINFEIIAEVKSDSKRQIKEFTFDSNGNLQNSRVLNTTSYEHVRY